MSFCKFLENLKPTRIKKGCITCKHGKTAVRNLNPRCRDCKIPPYSNWEAATEYS